jgi:hypothetical protein
LKYHCRQFVEKFAKIRDTSIFWHPDVVATFPPVYTYTPPVYTYTPPLYTYTPPVYTYTEEGPWTEELCCCGAVER